MPLGRAQAENLSCPVFYRAGSALKEKRGRSVESVGGGSDTGTAWAAQVVRAPD